MAAGVWISGLGDLRLRCHRRPRPRRGGSLRRRRHARSPSRGPGPPCSRCRLRRTAPRRGIPEGGGRIPALRRGRPDLGLNMKRTFIGSKANSPWSSLPAGFFRKAMTWAAMVLAASGLAMGFQRGAPAAPAGAPVGECLAQRTANDGFGRRCQNCPRRGEGAARSCPPLGPWGPPG